jgi:hypothetical protein
MGRTTNPRTGRLLISEPPRMAWAPSALLAPILVLLLVAPAAIGAHVVVLAAPYAGAVPVSSSSSWVYGCGHATVWKAGFFKASSGKAGFIARSSGTDCASITSNGGQAVATLATWVPLPITHKTASVIAVIHYRVWLAGHVVKWTSCGVINTSTYGYCHVVAYAALYGGAYLVDTTTDASFWWPSNDWAGATQYYSDGYYCYGGSCQTSTTSTTVHNQVTGTFGFWINVTGANAADRFALVLYATGSTGADVYHYGATMVGGNASAYINAASHGEGIYLASVTIA